MLKRRVLIQSFILLIFALPNIGVGAEGKEGPSPTVDVASLAEKSMGDVIKTLGKPRYCTEFDFEKMKSRIPPGTPNIDDACAFRIGMDHFMVYSWRGRPVAFYYIFGNLRKRPTKPEDALRRVGIDVRDVKPSQVLKNPSERPFTSIQEPPPLAKAIVNRLTHIQDIIWSGKFNDKKWKELRVIQSEDDNRCPKVIAILDYDARQ
jgi:hypothetical protein